MKEYEREAEKIMDKHNIPGAGVGLNQDDNPLYFKGFGYRNIEEELEVTTNTMFGIASMTKAFTCVAIMQLQEGGLLSAQDKVIDHLPKFRMPNNGDTNLVTIHHLMTHTSGIPPSSTHIYARKDSIDKDPAAIDYGLDLANHPGESIQTYDELIRHIASLDVKLLGSPGNEFSYSNDCYGLLGALINQVSGIPYEDYVKNNILQPAGMTDSFFDIEEIEKQENITMLYANKKTKNTSYVYAAPVWWDAPSMRATGYLKSTVNDILTFLELFRNDGLIGNDQILKENSVKQMIYPHVEFEKGKFYGYGLRITPDYYGSTLIEHGGGLKGVSSLMCVVPEKGLSGVVLSNLDGVPAGKLLQGALNVVQNKPFSYSENHFENYDIMESELKKFVGTYKSDEGMNLRFSIMNGALTLHSGTSEEKLRYIDHNQFLTNDDRIIRFPVNEHGQVDRVCYSSRQIYKEQ